MTHKEFLTAFLGKTLNIPADKVASLLNDEGTEVKAEALAELLTADATRVQKFKEENQTYFENGQKKATKEILSARDKEIKEKYGVNSDKIGLDLLDEVIVSKSGDKGVIDENKVKTHPLYLQLQDDLTKKVGEVETTWKTKLETIQNEQAEKETFSGVLKKAETFLPGFDLPKDEKLKGNQKKFFEAEMKNYKYKPHGDNDYLVLKPDGSVLEDGHGNRITYDAHVKNILSNYWAPLEGERREGAGGDNNAGGKGKEGSAWKGKVPANDAEYSAAIAAEKDPNNRIAIADAYKASKEGAKQ